MQLSAEASKDRRPPIAIGVALGVGIGLAMDNGVTELALDGRWPSHPAGSFSFAEVDRKAGLSGARVA
jgi:hypothetical protein